LGFIAGISLVVGGIGIMNIMLVSVTERTREIGIRLAVGAHGSEIQLQFLTEAVVLSAFGGTLGILLGIVTSELVSYLKHWPTQVSPIVVVCAFLGSAAVGIVSGFYPARKASLLDPIDALRYE
jgi:putative ABC transport system permease protein